MCALPNRNGGSCADITTKAPRATLATDREPSPARSAPERNPVAGTDLDFVRTPYRCESGFRIETGISGAAGRQPMPCNPDLTMPLNLWKVLWIRP